MAAGAFLQRGFALIRLDGDLYQVGGRSGSGCLGGYVWLDGWMCTARPPPFPSPPLLSTALPAPSPPTPSPSPPFTTPSPSPPFTQSTIESLHYLYPLLQVGGHVVIDDFTDWRGCREATADYRERHGITERIEIVYKDVSGGQDSVAGVWWTKREQVGYNPMEGPPVEYKGGSVGRG